MAPQICDLKLVFFDVFGEKLASVEQESCYRDIEVHQYWLGGTKSTFLWDLCLWNWSDQCPDQYLSVFIVCHN